MVRRKPTASRKAGKSTRRGFPWFKWLLGLSLLGALILGAYSLYLSQIVRVKFEGRRWAIPARVYARPLELYVGADLTVERLRTELQALGYRKVRQATQPAQWSQSGSRFIFQTRDFLFWDGREASRRVGLRISNGAVTALKDASTGRDLDLLRLEPPEIGSIYPSHKEDRVLVRRDELPDHLVAALLAAEDHDYFHHHGVNPLSIARAVMANLKAGHTVQGGSTLTQQLVKNFFLTPERSLWRKFNEALMAIILDARYSKDEILEAYANEVFLGQDGERAIHGFGLASYFYFNRPLAELRLHETALLVGLLKGASYYDPRRHPKRALKRRNLVLQLMADQGFIDQATARKAMQQPLGVGSKGRRSNARHPAFIDLVRRQLRQDYQEEDLTSEGLRIFTTLDPWAQQILDTQIARGLSALEKSRRKLAAGSLQAAMVLVSPQGGEIRALSGGRNAGYAGFNRALDARRSIGSLIKPVIYLLALSRPREYSLVTLLEDEPVNLKDARGRVWSPKNYDHKVHGLVPLHTALAHSYNLATVHLGLALGLDKVVRQLKAMGVQRSVRSLPSLLLGAVPLSPLEVAQVYQAIASGGFRAPLRAIREITDQEGNPLQRYPLEVKQVAEPGPVYLLSRNLVEVMRQGTGRSVRRYLPESLEVAGKTGTTDELRDSWFAGFSGDWLAVAWVGRDDNKSAGLTGSSGALTLWGRVMKALKPQPLGLLPPENVVYVWVDARTGYLSAEDCEGAIAMPFIRGSEPELRSECLGEEKPRKGLFDRLFD
ncbi:penicillin-binding protein 1B [Thiolapillus brandeum]|uniref:Penicillin-binding protein 1B n=1 Tax=Thiolapillus brandeum TaxID=1076588 RepID=A0A7U6GJV4_9GAMM|nr:penicillin-binding protein 1B [Thiolapillus brandeum]